MFYMLPEVLNDHFHFLVDVVRVQANPAGQLDAGLFGVYLVILPVGVG
jgi:hypothetical protein